MLYTILELHAYSTATPANLNTIAGLRRHIELELTQSHRYGVFEMGAYRPGDIDTHASVIEPDWGIITAVGPQHLERYDSINQILETKFELAKHVRPWHLIVNLDSEPIKKYLQSQPYSSPVTVSLLDLAADYYVASYTFDEGSIQLKMKHGERTRQYALPGFGTARVYAAAITVAISQELGVPEKIIQRGLALNLPDPHRLGVSRLNKATIINNTYSSNPDSFRSVVSDIDRLSGKKALMTPGLIELGDQSKQIHESLGKRAGEVFNSIILVGETNRTVWLETGIKAAHTASYERIDVDYDQYWHIVEKLSLSHDYVLLENDIPKHVL